jgi:hypothetical protein
MGEPVTVGDRERRVIATFLRIQDAYNIAQVGNGFALPEQWRKAYEDLRALVDESDIAAAPDPGIEPIFGEPDDD